MQSSIRNAKDACQVCEVFLSELLCRVGKQIQLRNLDNHLTALSFVQSAQFQVHSHDQILSQTHYHSNFVTPLYQSSSSSQLHPSELCPQHLHPKNDIRKAKAFNFSISQNQKKKSINLKLDLVTPSQQLINSQDNIIFQKFIPLQQQFDECPMIKYLREKKQKIYQLEHEFSQASKARQITQLHKVKQLKFTTQYNGDRIQFKSNHKKSSTSRYFTMLVHPIISEQRRCKDQEFIDQLNQYQICRKQRSREGEKSCGTQENMVGFDVRSSRLKQMKKDSMRLKDLERTLMSQRPKRLVKHKPFAVQRLKDLHMSNFEKENNPFADQERQNAIVMKIQKQGQRMLLNRLEEMEKSKAEGDSLKNKARNRLKNLTEESQLAH